MASDLAEVIARVRRYIKAQPGAVVPVPQATMTSLLDAAEAGAKARDAALEEVESELRGVYVTDDHNTLGFHDAIDIVAAIKGRPA